MNLHVWFFSMFFPLSFLLHFAAMWRSAASARVCHRSSPRAAAWWPWWRCWPWCLARGQGPGLGESKVSIIQVMDPDWVLTVLTPFEASFGASPIWSLNVNGDWYHYFIYSIIMILKPMQVSGLPHLRLRLSSKRRNIIERWRSSLAKEGMF